MRFPSLHPTALLRGLLGALALLLASCGPTPERLALQRLESSASEALMRHIYTTCPFQKEVGAVCLMLTAQQQEPSQLFRDRFKNLGPRILRHQDINAVKLADVVRILEKTPGPDGRALVLLVQVTEIEKQADGSLKAVAAWAYKDDMERREYIVKGEGPYTIEPGAVLEKKTAPVSPAAPAAAPAKQTP